MRSKYLLIVIFSLCSAFATAQVIGSKEGKCSNDVIWSFDGQTLFIDREPLIGHLVSIPDYDNDKDIAPWIKRAFPVKHVKIGEGIKRIGKFAFANCRQLVSVEFENDKYLSEIGVGAFYNCINLFNLSIPINIKKIEKAAFANCFSLSSVKIPSQAKVEDRAFMSCTKLKVLEIAVNVELGRLVFATEANYGAEGHFEYYNGEIISLPLNVTTANCQEYGISKDAVRIYWEKTSPQIKREVATSAVDTMIPKGISTRYDTYALIIGNENYRFVSNVLYAQNDARVFSEYCKVTLGIPANNIHLVYDATKHMILEQEIDDWLKNSITNKNRKKLIIYYAGHGVPDINDNCKSYILPTDVYGTKPKQGIELNGFYATIGNLGFRQVTIFMDACFSGVNRNNESLNEGLRGTEVEAPESELSTGNLVVFCAAQGNETAQGYLKEGHGLYTYYILKEIQESGGQITYGALAKATKNDVLNKAPTLELRKTQTPMVNVSETLVDSWENIEL